MTIEQSGGKPLQRVTEKERNANGKEHYKRTADYYISGAQFDDSTEVVLGSSTRRNRKMLYEIYNNQIPLEFFRHITNPFNTDKKEYQNWPAKIRPTTILRTNLDQLMSEYPKRPFTFFVSNLGQDAYNAFLDGLNEVLNKTLQRKFIQIAQQVMQEQGASLGEEAQQIAEEEIPTPEEVATAYKANYKDKLAIKGQKRLNRLMAEVSAKRLFQKMFKDWVIAGEARSYKGVYRSVLDYKRVSPLNIDHDKSPDVEFIEDGEWVVARYLMTYSDIVDEFYDDLKKEDHEQLEKGTVFSTPQVFHDHLKGLYTDRETLSGKIPVYHVCWKGKQLMKKVTSVDPLTGEEHEDYLDESYPAAPGEKTENVWVNCVYETYRIGDDLYMRMQEIPNQRREMNNFSSCKLPYNGKNFSDDHAQNISLVEIGLPFQILYIIITRALELTLAKSKGKIVLLDQNVIPRKNGWDEDKFFYYSEALGYGLIDRSGIGVDKSFNQYQVLDMTLFDSIQQLIELQQHIKNEWDEILGFSRQRKGQTFATDTVGANSQALFQSTVITDMIFIGFEEFVERELQGLLDLSKFVDVDGVRKIYNESELDYQLLEIDPEEYASAELGIFVTKYEIEKLRKLEAYAETFAINGAKPSTVVEMLTSDNLAMLKANLRKAEEAESKAAMAQSQNEQAGQQALEEIRQRYLQLEKSLDLQQMHQEYDRKESIEHIKGSYALHRNLELNDGDNNDNGIPDASEIMGMMDAREQRMADERTQREDLYQKDRHKAADLALKQQELQQRERESKAQRSESAMQRRHELKLKQLEAAEKSKDRAQKMAAEKLKAKTALKNKTSGEKK